MVVETNIATEMDAEEDKNYVYVREVVGVPETKGLEGEENAKIRTLDEKRGSLVNITTEREARAKLRRGRIRRQHPRMRRKHGASKTDSHHQKRLRLFTGLRPAELNCNTD